MPGQEILSLALAIGTGVCVVMLAFWIGARAARPESAPARTGNAAPSGAAIFLFHGGVLVDANAPALERVGAFAGDNFDWSDLYRLFGADYPGLPRSQGAMSGNKLSLRRADPACTSLLTVDQWDDVTRITLQDCAGSPARDREPSLQAVFDAPNPIWQADDTGCVIWSNAAYDRLAEHYGSTAEDRGRPLFSIEPATPGDKPTRVGLADKSSAETLWFDVVTVRSHGVAMHYATDASAIVQAEIAQRNFVQTLTKTFAQLSIGLAIFDRNRQLALFNPALIDLTALPADFLSARPSLMSFFDRMRDNRVMPEPKNYAGWRERIAELVVAASDGRYAETWTLPSGLTYRVTGRPHPDGAIAFLFEDISAEISLTRRFRADLELGQSVLDAQETAIVVFSSSGELTLCNRAYRELWRTDPDNSFAEYTLRDAIPVWQAGTRQTRAWSELRKRIMTDAGRSDWSTSVTFNDGRRIDIVTQPVDRGATLVRFEEGASTASNASRATGDLALSQ